VTKPIGVVCKEAGGANLIASFVLNNPGNYIFYLDQPAQDLFTNYLGKIENVTLETISVNCHQVIAGLGINEFEFNAIDFLRSKSVRVCCYLDHWINFPERFQRLGRKIIPSEIWVSDRHAYSIVQNIFPQIQIQIKENYYLLNMRDRFESDRIGKQCETKSRKTKLLYLTEPIAREGEDPHGRFKFDEFDALRNFFHRLQTFNDQNIEVRLRMHPSEIESKYASIQPKIEFSTSVNTELIQDLIWADVVIGVDTYAMYVSDFLGIPTYTSAPDPDFQATIPSESILKLSSFIGNNLR